VFWDNASILTFSYLKPIDEEEKSEGESENDSVEIEDI
jgi:hypothetical protein